MMKPLKEPTPPKHVPATQERDAKLKASRVSQMLTEDVDSDLGPEELEALLSAEEED